MFLRQNLLYGSLCAKKNGIYVCAADIQALSAYAPRIVYTEKGLCKSASVFVTEIIYNGTTGSHNVNQALCLAKSHSSSVFAINKGQSVYGNVFKIHFQY